MVGERYTQSRMKLSVVAIFGIFLIGGLEFFGIFYGRSSPGALFSKALLGLVCIYFLFLAARSIIFPSSIELSSENLKFRRNNSNKTLCFLWSDIDKITKFDAFGRYYSATGIQIVFFRRDAYNSGTFLLPRMWGIARADLVNRLNYYLETSRHDVP